MKQLVRKLSKVKSLKASGAEDSKFDSPDGEAPLKSAKPNPHATGAGIDVARLKIPFVKNSKGTRVAFTLLLVRPWVLLVGFWLFSLLGAAVALEGMISPRKLSQALPQVTEVKPVATSSLINVEQSADDIAAGEVARSDVENGAGVDAAQGEAVLLETADGRNFPVRTLGVLVGTCAAGCLVMSRRRAMMRMAAARTRSRNRRVRAGKKVAPNVLAHKQPSGRKALEPAGASSTHVSTRVGPVKSTAAKPARKLAGTVKLAVKTGAKGLSGANPPSRAKKRRQRNKRGAIQPVASRTSGNRPLVSRSTAQKNAAPTTARPRPVKRKSSRVASRRPQSVVSVVPASASHALDWPNGSLAHDMDVRPQRKAM